MSVPAFTNNEYQVFLDGHSLMGSRCQHCGVVFLPPHPMCTSCYGQEMTWVDLGETGTLAAFTAIHIAPTAMIEAGYGRDNPYVTGIVKLDSGPSISAQITGVDASEPESIQIGLPVRANFVERENGDHLRTYLVFEAI